MWPLIWGHHSPNIFGIKLLLPKHMKNQIFGLMRDDSKKTDFLWLHPNKTSPKVISQLKAGNKTGAQFFSSGNSLPACGRGAWAVNSPQRETDSEGHMRVAGEISVSLRASLDTSSALCPPHMSLSSAQTDRGNRHLHMWADRHGKLGIKRGNASPREGEAVDSQKTWQKEQKASSRDRLRGLLVYHCPRASFGTPAAPCPPPHISPCQGVPYSPLQGPCSNCANAKNNCC